MKKEATCGIALTSSNSDGIGSFGLFLSVRPYSVLVYHLAGLVLQCLKPERCDGFESDIRNARGNKKRTRSMF
jgi:hypothetical protein